MSGKLYRMQCARCTAQILAKVNRPGYCLCAECRKKARRKAYKTYRDSEKGKAGRKARMEKYKADGREDAWRHKWAKSDKNKENQRRYNAAHREERNEYQRRYRERNYERIAEHNRIYRKLRYWFEPERFRLIDRLRRAVRNGVPGARLALAKATGKLTYCPRMHVTAYPLPCGKREECRGCPHCPQGADFGAEQRQRDFSVTGGWLI